MLRYLIKYEKITLKSHFAYIYFYGTKFPLPHSRGSSHGQSRGIRKAYPEPFLTQMMHDAYQQWHALEEENGIQLMK